jgi:hypothetical protein
MVLSSLFVVDLQTHFAIIKLTCRWASSLETDHFGSTRFPSPSLSWASTELPPSSAHHSAETSTFHDNPLFFLSKPVQPDPRVIFPNSQLDFLHHSPPGMSYVDLPWRPGRKKNDTMPSSFCCLNFLWTWSSSHSPIRGIRQKPLPSQHVAYQHSQP